MSGESIWVDIAGVTLETNGGAVSNGSLLELTDDDLQSADVAGRPGGWFEFVGAATSFSTAPTAGAIINIYEQKISSDPYDSPDVSSTHKRDFIGATAVKPTNSERHVYRFWVPINKSGGKYWLEWLDGGAGNAQIAAGWVARIIPTSEGQAA